MLVRVLKTNQPINYFILLIAGILFWLVKIIHPQPYTFFTGENENVLYKPIDLLINSSPFLQTVLSLLAAMVMAVVIQQINSRYAFIRVRNMIPAPLFIIILGGMMYIHTMHPVYFGALFMLFAIYRLFGTYDKSKNYSAVFDVGLLVGIGSLFYFGLLFLLPAFLIGVGMLGRDTGWRDYTILLLGFVLPLFFALSFGILTEHFLEILKTFEQNVLTANKKFSLNPQMLVFFGWLILITALGSIGIIQQYDTKKVSSRKYFVFFFLIFIFSIGTFVFIPAVSHEILIITAIPVTYLIANYLAFMKSRFFSELLFSLLVLLVIIQQFFAG